MTIKRESTASQVISLSPLLDFIVQTQTYLSSRVKQLQSRFFQLLFVFLLFQSLLCELLRDGYKGMDLRDGYKGEYIYNYFRSTKILK